MSQNLPILVNPKSGADIVKFHVKTEINVVDVDFPKGTEKQFAPNVAQVLLDTYSFLYDKAIREREDEEAKEKVEVTAKKANERRKQLLEKSKEELIEELVRLELYAEEIKSRTR